MSFQVETPIIQIESWACRRNGWNHAETVRTWPQLTFSRAGTYRLRQVCSPVLVEPTGVVVMNSLEPYTTSPVDEHECSGWSIRVREDVASELFRNRTSGPAASERLFSFPLLRCSPKTFARERRLARMAARPGVSELQVEEAALAVLHSLAEDQTSRPDSRPAPWGPRSFEVIERTRELLLRSLGRNIGLAEIGRRVGVSPWHLTRTFRKCTGQSVHQYLSTLRLRAALDLLLDTRTDLLTIAIDLGYSHASHFAAEFRRAYGATPSSFRKEGARNTRGEIA